MTVLLSMTMRGLAQLASTTISRMLSSLRASPPLWRKRASVCSTTISLSRRSTSVLRARSSSTERSEASRDFRTKTWQRERRGVITSNEGFSVVAPMSITVPASTAPSRASCWALLKRWISSMKRIGAAGEVKSERLRAESMTSRTSFTPAVTADRVKNSREVLWAMILARVVLPTPGGPQSMKDERLPESIILRSMHPGPTRWV